MRYVWFAVLLFVVACPGKRTALSQIDITYSGTPCYRAMRTAVENTSNFRWPDRVEKFDSGDYHTRTWWWHGTYSHYAVTFTWRDGGECEVSTYSS